MFCYVNSLVLERILVVWIDGCGDCVFFIFGKGRSEGRRGVIRLWEMRENKFCSFLFRFFLFFNIF